MLVCCTFLWSHRPVRASPRRRPLPHALLPAHLFAQQMAARRRAAEAAAGSPKAAMEERPLYTFTDLFKAIKIEDFSSYISKAGAALCMAA